MNEMKTITVGGQAVIEGVMMRSPHTIATAVRKKDGQIVTHSRPFLPLIKKYPFLNVPIIRGGIGIIEMMIIGSEALNFSAQEADDKATSQKSSFFQNLSVIIALTVGIAIFFVTPLSLTSFLFALDQNALQFNLMAGLIRTSMFLMYLFVISKFPDIHRIFEYHGAEHVSIYVFENKETLIAENGMKYDTPHPRCGTSFLMFVMIVSIISFGIIDSIYIANFGSMSLLERLAVHLPLIPVVAGLSYELIKLSAKYYHIRIARLFMLPGLWLQRITTKKPHVDQIEVAMVALKAALGEAMLESYAQGKINVAMSVHE